MFEISDAAKRDIEAMDWASGDIPTEGVQRERKSEREREKQKSQQNLGAGKANTGGKEKRKRKKEKKPREVTQTYSVRG